MSNLAAERKSAQEHFRWEVSKYMELRRQGQAGAYVTEQALLKKIFGQAALGIFAIGMGTYAVSRAANLRKRTATLAGLAASAAFVTIYPAQRLTANFSKFAESERSVYADAFCPDVLTKAHAAMAAGQSTTGLPAEWLRACETYMERKQQTLSPLDTIVPPDVAVSANPAAQPGYGLPQSNYGTPAQSNYSSPAQSGYGGVSPSSYGTGVPPSSYGANVPPPSYGANVPPPSYGASVPPPSYGAPPSYGPGYNQPSYGLPSQSNFGSSGQSGYGSPAPSLSTPPPSLELRDDLPSETNSSDAAQIARMQKRHQQWS